MHYVSWAWSQDLSLSDSISFALIDDPIYFSPLIAELVRRNIPIVALCHNIESLSRPQLTSTGQRALLNYELDLLSICSLIVTISREETVFLNNLGLNAVYYPYYPVKDMQMRMLSIREQRKTAKKEGFLLVGTANNPPTMKGMREIIENWSSISKLLDGAKLYVAGYGSESLKDLANHDSIIFRGTVTSDELDELMSRTEACIAYQLEGSGALTRIPEFILAGIPVLANSHAARSYYGANGVFEFGDLKNFAVSAKSIRSKNSEIDIPLPPDPQALIAPITALSLGSQLGRKGQGVLLTPSEDCQFHDQDQLIESLISKNQSLQCELDRAVSSWCWRITESLRKARNTVFSKP